MSQSSFDFVYIIYIWVVRCMVGALVLYGLWWLFWFIVAAIQTDIDAANRAAERKRQEEYEAESGSS